MKKILTIVPEIYVKMVEHALTKLMHMIVAVHQILWVHSARRTLMNVRCVHLYVKMVQHVQIRWEAIRVFVLMAGPVLIVVLILMIVWMQLALMEQRVLTVWEAFTVDVLQAKRVFCVI